MYKCVSLATQGLLARKSDITGAGGSTRRSLRSRVHVMYRVRCPLSPGCGGAAGGPWGGSGAAGLRAAYRVPNQGVPQHSVPLLDGVNVHHGPRTAVVGGEVCPAGHGLGVLQLPSGKSGGGGNSPTVTDPGRDLVVTMDTGGLGPNLVNNVINNAWPQAVGAAPGATLSD